MANSISASGLTVATRAELLAYFTAAYQTIYGADINIDQDTPDGQQINIYIQSVLDLEDLLVQIYNSFDPDNAIGTVLDQRVAINGIQRQAGTNTVTNITLVTDRSLNLFGLDQDVEPPYTVQDSAGNEWILISTVSVSGAGSHVYAFEAALPGAVLTVPNTITIPVTIVLGVLTINNPTTYTTLGVNEETDAALRIRRQQSVALPSQGYLAGLYASLLNIDGVSFAFVEENTSGTTNSDGVPGHSIWVIVSGTGADADIAQAIYAKRNAGCGMFGDTSFSVTQVDGTSFLVYWDEVEPENLFIRFTATSIDGITPPNVAAIREGLVTLFVPGVAETVNVNDLATQVQAIDPNTLVTSAGFSLTAAGAFTNTLTPTLKKNQFVVIEADIIIIPILLTPQTSTVAPADTIQFVAAGGFGAYTYSLFVNNSGGSINSVTGLYTAGAVPSTDTIRVTDAQSHTTDVPVVVI